MADGVFKLDLNETFPRLARPPIVEAVIHWQARAQKPMEPESLRAALAERLPMYPESTLMQGFGLTAMLSAATAEAPALIRAAPNRIESTLLM